MTSLTDICLPVVIGHDYWRVQRRHLQSLPEEIVDAILAGLIRRGRVDFVNLGLFAHSCSTVHLSGREIGNEARAWLHTLSHFSGLGTLHITGAERLQEDALATLAPLAALLQELSLHGCSVLRDRAGQHLQALTRLTYLDIGGTRIPSACVAGLRSLAVLSMHKGLIKGNDRHSFSQLSNLEVLDMSDTDMGNNELRQLQFLPRLHDLRLTWTKVTRPPLVSSLTSLELGNVEVAPTPEDLDWLEDNGPLLCFESLRIPGASLSLRGEVFMRILLQFSAEWLSVLDLGHVTATNLDFLEGLSQLNAVHTLDVSGNQTLSDLHVLRHMTSLRDLNLSQTDTIDAGLFRITAMSQLTRLSLRDTSVTANVFRALAPLDSLQSLDLSHTAIHHGLRNLGAPAALSPKTLLAVGTKLSDRDVAAVMAFAGRRLQELHLGTSIIEGLSCLRAAAGLENLVLAGCNCITEEQFKSAAGLFPCLQSLTIHHCFLLTESLAADIHLWAPDCLTTIRLDDASYSVTRRKGGKIGVLINDSPTKQPSQRRASMEELQAYDERLRYSKEDLESIAGRVHESGTACAAFAKVVQSLDLSAAK